MSDPTWTNRSGFRRRGDGTEPESGLRPGGETAADDWLGEEIDWSEEGERVRPEGARAAEGARPTRRSRVGLIPTVEPATGEEGVDEEHLLLVRRRRMAAIGLFGLLLACAIAIPLVVFDSGESVAEQPTAPLTTTAPQTTTVEQPATTTTPTTTQSTQSTLRISLPAKGSLRRGDRGAAVEALQRGLAALGYSVGEPDGVFGQVTQAAVVDFQQSNNLNPDGVVGTDTVRLLNSALARRGVKE